MRTSTSAVREYVEERSPSHDLAALPPNMLVGDLYRPVLEMMRLRSPTFRRQCARIASVPSLLVDIRSDPPPMTERSLATTHVVRYEYGRIVATVRVAISNRIPELVAHELEHVLEQLDGVDLPAKARLPASGVRVCNCGGEEVFETTRAIVTGLRVAREAERP